MSNSYSSFCDDLYLDMYVNTELDLPNQRDTVLTFFERIQKQFPLMGNFFRRDNNDYCLEEDRKTGQYRWVALELDRLCSGAVNPASLEEVYNQDRLVLEIMPYMLGVNHLDIDSMDVTFTMDFDYRGNHDEVIAEAFFSSTPFNSFLDMPGAKPIGFSPVVVIALSEDCRTQARISVESKTSVYKPEKHKETDDEAISLTFTIRRYPSPSEKFDALQSFAEQCEMAERLMDEKIIANFVQPLNEVIVQKRLT